MTVHPRFIFPPSNTGLGYILLACVVLFAGWNSGTNLVYLVASLLFASFLVSFAYAVLSLPGLSIAVHLDREASENEEFAWEVSVTNSGWMARHFLEVRPRFTRVTGDGARVKWLSEIYWNGGDRLVLRMIRELIRPSKPGEPGRLVRSIREGLKSPTNEGRPGRLLHLAAGATARVPLKTRLPGRGEYRLDRVELYTTFPLKLYRVAWAFSTGGRVIVVPSMLRPFYSAATASEIEVPTESMVDAHRGEGLDYHGLRDYLPGDPPKRIHWKVTARTGRLMVREHQQNRSARYYLFLDLDERKRDGDGPSCNLEHCVRVAATLCRELVTANCHSQVLLLADEYAPSPGIFTASELSLLMRYLGSLPYTRRGSLAGMLARSVALMAPDSYVLFVLPSANEEDLGAISGLMGRGYRVSVLLDAEDRESARAHRAAPPVARLARAGCNVLCLSRATGALC